MHGSMKAQQMHRKRILDDAQEAEEEAPDQKCRKNDGHQPIQGRKARWFQFGTVIDIVAETA